MTCTPISPPTVDMILPREVGGTRFRHTRPAGLGCLAGVGVVVAA